MRGGRETRPPAFLSRYPKFGKWRLTGELFAVLCRGYLEQFLEAFGKMVHVRIAESRGNFRDGGFFIGHQEFRRPASDHPGLASPSAPPSPLTPLYGHRPPALRFAQTSGFAYGPLCASLRNPMTVMERNP